MLKLTPLPTKSGQFIEKLHATRSFPGGFWHATDLESAMEVMAGQLEYFGIQMSMPIAALEAQLGATNIVNDEDEDAARRASIALVAGAVNDALRTARETACLFQFEEDLDDWESDEPVWVMLTRVERDQLVADGTLRPLAETTME